MNHVWLYNYVVAFEVGRSRLASAEGARAILVGCTRVVVARQFIRTSTNFLAIANTVTVGVYTVASANAANVKFLTRCVGRIVEVARAHVAAAVCLVADAVTVRVTQAVAIAIHEWSWEDTLRLVVVQCFSVEVARRSIQTAEAAFEVT